MSDTPEYVPPKVWKWVPGAIGQGAETNRPIAGPTHEQELPRGAHPFQLYSLGTPNGQKVTIMLEELLAAGHDGAEYDAWFIDIGKGDQFGSGFVSVNPNSKIPAMMDYSGDAPLRLFESGSMLLHLAEKFGAFIPTDIAGRAECLNWLFWQMGSAPYLGGGFGHFYAYAPVKIEYAINRFTMEVKRQLDVLDRQLAERPYIAGDTYTIADIAIFPWYGRQIMGKGGYNGAEFIDAKIYTNVMRWAEEINAREPVKRGRCVNSGSGPEEEQLRERHSAADIDPVVAERKKSGTV